jgi:uncharacterized protein (TIGR02996 family)
MDTEEPLLAAIHDNPTDELVWTALADWLEESGQASRAELLRLHRCLRGQADGRQRLRNEKRVRELLARGVRPVVPLLRNSIGMELVLLPAGSFWMGSPENERRRYGDESPRHEVEITRPFYLGIHLVTQGQYQRVMRVNPSAFAPTGRRAEQVAELDHSVLPVDSVTWLDAVEFCCRLSALPAEKRAKRQYRLPTEAEWEYACRGGASSTAPYSFGSRLRLADANYDPRRGGSGRSRHPTPVGSYPPNAFGLYDMHGNLWEWCHDWLNDDYYAQSPRQDPPGPDHGTLRVLRGGSWFYIASSCRSAIRFCRAPEDTNDLIGFRAAVSWGG